MSKHTINFILDTTALILLLPLAGSGLVMHYTLPPGSHGITVWGLGRHDWGTIHYWIAIALVAVVALHIILHWSWVSRMIKGTKSLQVRRKRVALALVGFFGLLSLSLAPVFGKKVEVPEREAPVGEHTYGLSGDNEMRPFRIHGSLTLGELAAQSGISLATLHEALSIPSATAPDTRLRQLTDDYGFTMEYLRSTIDKLQQSSTNRSNDP